MDDLPHTLAVPMGVMAVPLKGLGAKMEVLIQPPYLPKETGEVQSSLSEGACSFSLDEPEKTVMPQVGRSQRLGVRVLHCGSCTMKVFCLRVPKQRKILQGDKAHAKRGTSATPSTQRWKEVHLNPNQKEHQQVCVFTQINISFGILPNQSDLLTLSFPNPNRQLARI